MSELHLNDGNREVTLDSRTSDAIALALRTNAPIFTTPEIVKKTGIYMEEEEEGSSKVVHKSTRTLNDFSIEELQEKMQRFVEEENYEGAAKIRNIIAEKRSANTPQNDITT